MLVYQLLFIEDYFCYVYGFFFPCNRCVMIMSYLCFMSNKLIFCSVKYTLENYS